MSTTNIASNVLNFPTTRPAHLIRVAVPRLNKCDHIAEYLPQLEKGDYDLEWAQVDETKHLTAKEWNELMSNLLTDRDWLADKGGTSSWTGPSDTRDYLQLTESEREQWKAGAYIHVVAVVAPTGTTVYIDPQGYRYARYLGFPVNGLKPSRTREEAQREREADAQDAKRAALAQRIANPPTIPEDHGLRFLWNGIKAQANGNTLEKCSYSMGTLNAPYPDGTISIYAADYHRFSAPIQACFDVTNDTDSQSDYFADDVIRVTPNHPLYSAVLAAFKAAEEHFAKVQQKRAAKWGQTA